MKTAKSRSKGCDRIRGCNQWNQICTWGRNESSDDPRYRTGYKQSRCIAVWKMQIFIGICRDFEKY